MWSVWIVSLSSDVALFHINFQLWWWLFLSYDLTWRLRAVLLSLVLSRFLTQQLLKFHCYLHSCRDITLCHIYFRLFQPSSIYDVSRHRAVLSVVPSYSSTPKMLKTAACRRCPLAVLFNILNMTGINSWIISKKYASVSDVSWWNGLRCTWWSNSPTLIIHQKQISLKLNKRVRCKVNTFCSCRRNLMSQLCIACKPTVVETAWRTSAARDGSSSWTLVRKY